MSDKSELLNYYVLKAMIRLTNLSLTDLLIISYRYTDNKAAIDNSYTVISTHPIADGWDVDDTQEINDAYVKFMGELSDVKKEAVTEVILLGVVRAVYGYYMSTMWSLDEEGEHTATLLNVINDILVNIHETDENN